ncbi:MAG: TfoX/Sxy family protein [bacterium]|nr:TfoX/Sxy family protein [bacterium]
MQDLLHHIPGISSRAMFGGYGIYKDGLIFGLIADDELYFKVDELNKSGYEKAGSTPFIYQRGSHPKTAMPYWKVPADVMEDRELIVVWVDKSVAASRRAKKR